MQFLSCSERFDCRQILLDFTQLFNSQMNFGREGDARHKGKKVISQSCTKVFEFIDGGE